MLGLVQRARVRIPGDALHVAVAERPHRRPWCGIVRRDRAIFVQPEDLPGEGTRALSIVAVFCIAGGHVELPVWTELEATAIVIVVPEDPVQDDRLLDAAIALVAHADDLVANGPARRDVRVVEVHEPRLREVGIECDAEQAPLAIDARARGDRGPGIRTEAAARAKLNDAHPAWAFGDEEPAVRREVDGPWRAQPRRDELHVLHHGRSDAGRRRRRRTRSRRRSSRRDWDCRQTRRRRRCRRSRA